MSLNRFVFDTNVIINALLFATSQPAQAFRFALKLVQLLLSLELLEELNQVLGRKKFNRYVTIEEREESLQALLERSTLIELTEQVQVCRDPKDNQVLELALSGQANYIISGDRDRLILNPFGNVKIVAATDFLQIVEDF